MRISQAGAKAPMKPQRRSVSQSGYEFDEQADAWKLDRDRTLYLTWLPSAATDALGNSLRSLLRYYACNYSPGYAVGIAEKIHKLLAWARGTRGKVVSVISSADVIGYRSTLSPRHEADLGGMVAALKKSADLRLQCIQVEALAALDEMRLKGTPKGEAVRLKCPDKGPLSEIEFHGALDALGQSFERGDTGLSDYALATLFFSTGRRTVQIGDLKAKDLEVVQADDGLKEYILNIPRRKQGLAWRLESKPVALDPDIGVIIEALIVSNSKQLGALGRRLGEDEKSELALFPNWKVVEQHASSPRLRFARFLTSQEGHQATVVIRAHFKATIDQLKVRSERTGKFLKLVPIRLRRSLATRAAREGYGTLVIAELLDHSDDQNARIYTENVPEHVDAINVAMAAQLAPLAQAFVGRLVDSERDAMRGSDPASRIRTESGEGAGTCGHFGFCGALSPIACYTCISFQPWLDGPHNEVLHALLSERKRLKAMTGDETIAGVNDRTILAVSQVVSLCNARRRMLGE